jgi:hypothetical protein
MWYANNPYMVLRGQENRRTFAAEKMKSEE